LDAAFLDQTDHPGWSRLCDAGRLKAGSCGQATK